VDSNIIKLLRPHQHQPAEHLSRVLSRAPSAVDWSDTGTGKTYVAASVAVALRQPTLVVCSAIAVSAWDRAAEHFGDSFSIRGYEDIATGRTPFGQWQHGINPRLSFLKCVVCGGTIDPAKPFPCFASPAGIHCVERRPKAHRYGHFIWHDNIGLLIFDEVHRCGGLQSLNSEMLIAARRQNIRTLSLSATAATSPLGMKALGYSLDLHAGPFDQVASSGELRPSFYSWLRRRGCVKDPKFHGWKWLVMEEKQRAVMAALRASVLPSRGVRVRTGDIPGFPECNISVEPFDVTSPELIEAAYVEMETALIALEQRAGFDRLPESALTTLLRGRQQIELLKVPLATEVAQDELDKGNSVVFFVNFKQTITELQRRFPDAGIVDGSPEYLRTRDATVELFQRNLIRVLICNSEAGGVSLSLQDLTGFAPRVGLVFPGLKAVSMRQVFGRLPRDGGKSPANYRVLLAAGTRDVQIQKALEGKLNNLDTLNDADLNPT
jgi:hypothetical protein